MKKLLKNQALEKIAAHPRPAKAGRGCAEPRPTAHPGCYPETGPPQNVKDILAHLSGWEERMQRQIRSILQKTPLPIYQSTPEFNRQVYQANQDRTLEDVLSSFERSFQDTLSLIQQLSEAEFAAGGIWQLVGFNTYNHYAWAYKAIQMWKQSRASQ
jgi:hypothetical protein